MLHAFAAVLACGGQRMVVGEELPVDGAPDDSGGSGPPVRGVGVSVVADCPPTPEERKTRLGCWPTAHVGSWRGFLLGNPMYATLSGKTMEFPLTDILLEVEPFGSARLSFGEPVLFRAPAGSGDPYLCAGSSPAVGCAAAESLIVGYDYAVEDIEIYDAFAAAAPETGGVALGAGAQLSFQVPLDEPWRVWCGLQEPERGSCDLAEQYGAAALGCYRLGSAPESADNDACQVTEGDVTRSVDCGWLAAREGAPCSCNGGGCFARRASLLMRLQLSNDGQALRGSVLAQGARELGHLEFLRESP